jgi:class 3 adenylate cyclase/tetratricopeptide (TPR) repeat protein
MAGCPSCGASNPERFRFCGTCGAALPEAHGVGQTRKVVTILFVDVSGSTELGERVDPEVMRRAMTRYFAIAQDVIEQHGGTVEKFIGDAVMAVFGVPSVHEDDALRAVRAAVDARQAIAVLNEDLAAQHGVRLNVRIGVNTGEVVAGEASAAQTFVTGDAANVASRLEGAAAPGEILIGATTQRLVRDLAVTEAIPALNLKGKQHPIEAHRVIEVAPATTTAPRRLSAPMVGRRDELNQLTDALARVNRDRACHLFTIVGGAGVGKSRLVREFIAGFGDEATVVRGRCLPYGAGITYWPVMEAAQMAAAIDPTDSPRDARAKLAALVADAADPRRVSDSLAVAIGLSREPIPTEELAYGVRKMLELLARRRSLVVVFDDLQWAEAAFLDLIEDTARWIVDSRLLLVCMARPDFLDKRPSWAGGLLSATTLALEPLSVDNAARMISELVGDSTLGAVIRQRIVETAEGNPLYVEEVLGMLIDRGVLTEDNDGWRLTDDVSHVEVPPTIHALLAARLDSLPGDERAVAQRGAVIGRVFEQVAVRELSPESDRDEIPRHLRELTRHQMIGPHGADDVYRFRHLLIRDAAYAALPKEERAILHERYATWLQASAGDRVAEYEEVLGYHLEQAHNYRRELGQHDQQVESLAALAGRWLGSAGQRALDRRDLKAAGGLLRRALDLTSPTDPNHWTVAVALALVVQDGEGADQATPIYEAILAAARGPTSAVLPEVAAEVRINIAWLAGQRGDLTNAQVRTAIATELRALTRAGHYRLAILAWRMIGALYQTDVDVGRAERSARRAARLAARSGDGSAEPRLLVDLVNLGVRSAMPIPEAIRLAEQALSTNRLDHSERMWAGVHLAYLAALEGRFDDARARFAETVAALTELGDTDTLADVTLMRARGEEEAGDDAAAEALYRAAMVMGEAGGWTGWTAGAAGRLASTLVRMGRDEEAETMATRALAEDPTPWGPHYAGAAKARILARRGEVADAISLAQRTIADSRAAGFEAYPIIFGFTAESLAAVLVAADRFGEARTVLYDLLPVYRAKGYLPGVQRVEVEIAALKSPAAVPD